MASLDDIKNSVQNVNLDDIKGKVRDTISRYGAEIVGGDADAEDRAH